MAPRNALSPLLTKLLLPRNGKLPQPDAARPAFALLKVGGEVVDEELDQLTAVAAYLADVGLMPAIVHGGGPQMNKELAKRGVQPKYVRGNRVTDRETLQVAEAVFTELNARVVDALESAGTKARGLPRGVFRSVVASPELGFVGEVKSVETNPVLSALKEGRVPVLTSLGFSDAEPVLNINADVAARQLALALKPRRVVYTSAKGGWIDDDTKRIVPLLDMSRDYDRLASLNYEGRQGTLLKLNEIKALLDGLPEDSAVTIAGASSVLTELFSDASRSTGTTFVKGSKANKLVRFDTIGSTDLGRLAKVLNAKLSSTELAMLQETEAYVLADNNYSCAAVLRKRTRDGLREVWALGVDAGARPERVWDAIAENEPNGVAWVVGGALDASRADGTATDHKAGKTVAWTGTQWNGDVAKSVLLGAAPTPVAKASSWRSPAPDKAAPAKRPDAKKVGLLGARGYVGRELVKLLANHPGFDLTMASSRALAGKKVVEEFGITAGGVDPDLRFNAVEGDVVEQTPGAKDVDVWVIALPNGLAPKWIAPLERVGRGANLGTGAVLIDLGADFRFDETWTYGLPERKGARDRLRGTRRISNPGCYATAAQVSIMPLVERLAVGDAPTVFGVSGYSGAGTTPSDKNDPLSLRDNLLPYASVGHMHERECSRHLTRRIAFMPHVAPFFQGIALTTSMHLAQDTTPEDLLADFSKFYANEPLIKVSKAAPKVRDNMTQHHVAVGGFAVDPKTRRVVVHATIDNLLKGAATQALQNLNLAVGFAEYEGIPLALPGK